ncbi:aldolase/citrate lyase family protein [Marinivivus vitaminiproducens]|uniref:aldolase/citrate lyase family protein n=1 Tax=Marinivivus vitaminiproducens TaxID=3035935 RepID=UPI0027A66E98|nr:aldolase/citrate lyase family protein [Geminicoccaceae bacterium SCSIO 64248]
MNTMRLAFAVCATLALSTTAQAQTTDNTPFRAADFAYGPRNDLPAGQPAEIWNPAKRKLLAGGPLIGGTIRSTDPRMYCAMAEAGYDFLWVEKQHEATEWEQAARMWRTCPGPAAPGARVAFENEKEVQIATDMGATVVVVPTVDTVEEAKRAIEWTYFPPMGRRSSGGGQGPGEIWNDVPGGYRQTWNDNVVLILMIETLEGVENARAIAKLPGVSAIFAASGDLGNFSGYKEGDPEYERLITEVAHAAEEAGVGLCGPLRWADRPGFTCFQASTESADIKRGAQAEIQEAMAAFQGRSGPSAAAANTAASVPVADVTAQCATITYEADCYAAIEKALSAVKGGSPQEIQAVQASLSDVVGKNPNHAERIREMVAQSGLAIDL